MGERKPAPAGPSRRSFVGWAGAGMAVLVVAGGLRRVEPKQKIRRPPGALPEDQFLSLCNRCLKCRDICPAMIVPVKLTESIINAGTPRLLLNCPRCMRCVWACPTGALRDERISAAADREREDA